MHLQVLFSHSFYQVQVWTFNAMGHCLYEEKQYTLCMGPRQSGAVDVLKALCSHVLLTWMAGAVDKHWMHTVTSCIVL